MENLYLLTTENIILLSVIVFFSGLLLVKIILKDRIKFIWQISISFSILLAFYVGLFLYVGDVINGNHYSKKAFDVEVWHNNRLERVSMVDDLVDSEVLLNQSLQDITDLLGKPTYMKTDSLSYLEYDLGNVDAGLGINRMMLYLEIDNGIVSKAEKLSIYMD